MNLARNLVQHFVVKNDRVHGRAFLHGAEGLVEVPASPAQAGSVSPDGSSRDDDEVDFVDRDRAEQLSGWFGHPEQALELGPVVSDRPVEEAVFATDREQDADVVGQRPVEEGACVGFVDGREVAGDAARVKARDEGDEIVRHSDGGVLPLVGGEILAPFAQLSAEGALLMVGRTEHGPIVSGGCSVSGIRSLRGYLWQICSHYD